MFRTRVTAAAIIAVVAGASAPAADAAYVGKREARGYLLDAMPKGAPRVMLPDERGRFFRTDRLWVQRADGCRRRSDVAVSCRYVARLVPDASHRARNWWPIRCRGSVLVGRLPDGRLKGTQGDYVCRTVRP